MKIFEELAEKIIATGYDLSWKTNGLRFEIIGLIEQVFKQTPIDMILHCPKCHQQHIDAPDELRSGVEIFKNPQTKDILRWTNPPHRSHLCAYCGHIWRPADVCTNGVATIKTRGKNDA